MQQLLQSFITTKKELIGYGIPGLKMIWNGAWQDGSMILRSWKLNNPSPSQRSKPFAYSVPVESYLNWGTTRLFVRKKGLFHQRLTGLGAGRAQWMTHDRKQETWIAEWCRDLQGAQLRVNLEQTTKKSQDLPENLCVGCSLVPLSDSDSCQKELKKYFP